MLFVDLNDDGRFNGRFKPCYSFSPQMLCQMQLLAWLDPPKIGRGQTREEVLVRTGG